MLPLRCGFAGALFTQASEGQTAGEATVALFEGITDGVPGFTGGLGDGAGRFGWPSAGPRVKCLDPVQDLRKRQVGKLHYVPPPAMLGE